MRNVLGKTVWINPASSKDKPIHGIVFAQGHGGTWDRETQCVAPGNLIFGLEQSETLNCTEVVADGTATVCQNYHGQ